MYEVYIKDGVERKLSGTNKEIRLYNMLMNIWCKRHCFYWLFLVIQIAPIIAIAIAGSVPRYLYILPLAVIFVVHSLLWISTQFSYPFEHPILNCIKHRILIKGKFIAVTTWNDKEKESVEFGFYQYYDEQVKSHVVNVSGENKYYKFHQLSPIRG